MNIQIKIAMKAWELSRRIENIARNWMHQPFRVKRITCDCCGKTKWTIRRRILCAPDNSDMEVCAKCYDDVPF
jgi:hypothetical protein